MRILCTGDIHIGRRPSKLSLEESSRFSAAAMWRRIVEGAINGKINYLLLSGDIVDRRDRYFEAYGVLADGLSDLAQAGIKTVAVAGNHDFDTLPRLVDSAAPEGFTLLGRNGTWESIVLSDGENDVVRVEGWSFPRQHVHDNPLTTYNLEKSDTPAIGLLHADLDVAGSHYAPVSTADLSSTPHRLWVLGHVHVPRLAQLPAGRRYLYTGSPQGLDPAEGGKHGPWLIDTDKSFVPAQLNLAPFLYDTVTVDVSELEETEHLQAHIVPSIKSRLLEFAEMDYIPEKMSCRIKAVGRTKSLKTLQAAADDFTSQNSDTPFGATVVNVEQLSLNEVALKYDLTELSKAITPPGRVARVIQAMTQENPDRAYSDLIANAARKIENIRANTCFQSLGHSSDTDANQLARELLIHEGYRLLDTLLGQVATVSQ
jgi:exonuclease SbcD